MQTPLSVTRTLLLLLMACLGVGIFSNSVSGVETGRYAFSGASNGYFISLGLALTLTRAGHLQERVVLGVGGLSASLLGGLFVLSGEMPYGSLLQACAFAAAQGLMTLLFLLVDSKNGRLVNSTLISFIYRLLPLAALCMVLWVGETPGAIVVGILLLASAVLAGRELFPSQR